MSIGVKKKHQHSSNQLLVTQNQRTKQIQSLLSWKYQVIGNKKYTKPDTKKTAKHQRQ